MPKLQIGNEDWINLGTELPMTVDTFMYGPGQPDKAETLIYDGTVGVWAIATGLPTAISMQEVS